MACANVDAAIAREQLDGCGWVITHCSAQFRITRATRSSHRKIARDFAVARLSVELEAGIRGQCERDLAVRRAQRVIALGQRPLERNRAIRRAGTHGRVVRIHFDAAIARVKRQSALTAIHRDFAVRNKEKSGV